MTETNIKPMTGANVTAHKGTMSVGTMFISETFRDGKIAKVNEKSIRIRFENERRTVNGKVQSELQLSTEATFSFWKYSSDRNAIYKNAEHGIVTL
ncbi:MAG: hypothetical protein LBN02_01800 [Oscillospiraceae bacterium]|jgi:hypothetical protein|nr:hypothetical protein [Oscillospiraceae bacterium]